MSRFDRVLMAVCVALCVLFAGGMAAVQVGDWVHAVTRPAAPTAPVSEV